jgi:hypothetical protein
LFRKSNKPASSDGGISDELMKSIRAYMCVR